MKRGKRITICIALFLCIICLSSCGLTEFSDQKNIHKTMDAIESGINSKDIDIIKNLFSPSIAKNVSDLNVEKIFSLFPSGITYKNTDSESYPATYESIKDDVYIKNLEWHKELIDNATQKEYVMIINICTENWNDKSDIGMKYIVFYRIDQEESALEWLYSVDEEMSFKGIYIYSE